MIRDALKTFVVVNPNSSGGKTGKGWEPLKEAIHQQVGRFEFGFTQFSGHGATLAAEAVAKGFEMVVSLGGDGTHNEVANGLLQGGSPDKVVLAIVTSGTGGDFRRTLGLGKGPLPAIRCLSGRSTRTLDVGRFTYVDHGGAKAVWHFINILSFGIGGLVDHIVNTSGKALGGKATFFLATLRALAKFKPAEISLSVDDGSARVVTIHNVAIANGKYFGGGMLVAPDAAPDDGQFDVVSFEGMSTLSFAGLGSSIYAGKHVTNRHVTVTRARRVVATSKDRVLLDVDGEPKGMLPLTVDLMPGALRVKVAS
jgi:YegS/Rv2252/BmrU family lipid kinase